MVGPRMTIFRYLLAFLNLPLIITGKLVKNTNILFYAYLVIFASGFVKTFLVTIHEPGKWATMGISLMFISDIIYITLTQLCQLLDRFFMESQYRIYNKLLNNHQNTDISKSKSITLITIAISIVIFLNYIDYTAFESQPILVLLGGQFLMCFRVIWFLFAPIKFYLLLGLVNNQLDGVIKTISYNQRSKILIYACFDCYKDVFGLFEHVQLLHVTLLLLFCPLIYFAIRMDFAWEYLAWNTLLVSIFAVLDNLRYRCKMLVSMKQFD